MIGGMINVDAYESSKIPLKLRNFENRQKKVDTDYNSIIDESN